MEKNIFYSFEVIRLVKKIYGENSEIFQRMNNGEKISSFIKADIKRKGKAKGAHHNFKAKKELFEMANMEECYKELYEANVQRGFID